VLASAWPRMRGEVEEVRRDPSPLNGLGVAEITDHYAEIIRGLDRPPIIIGHSFRGLLTELLLDRGLGGALAGAGQRRAPPPARAAGGRFPRARQPGEQEAEVELTPKQLHYGFTNTMTVEQAGAA
jgi:hypothetical protein